MPRSNKNLNPSEQMISCPSCGAEYPNDTKFCPVDGTALNVSASAKDALIGRVIAGKYRILEKLGGGGMGAVYRAEHSLMSRIVAVKVLRGHLTDNENSLKRFQHEARIACRLDHPNAVTTYDFGIDDDLPYLVMEFIKGRSLNQILKDEGPLPLDRALRVLRQICDALSQAHELGIIHRDLKPDNFMITEVLGKDEFVKVLDFGVAKMLQQDPTESLTVLTQAGTIFGSPQYMAPEQIESRELDPRTDVYALGVVFFEMLTGEVPYHGVGLDLLVKHLHEKPRSVRDTPYGKKIPPAVDDAIRKALAKKKEDRFESVDAFCQSVEAAADSSRTTLIRIPLAGVKSTITSMKQGVSRLGQTTKKGLVFPFVTLGRLLKSAATGIASGLGRIFSSILTAIRNAFSALTKLVRGIFRLLVAVPIKLIAALKFLAIKIGGLLAASFGGLFGVVRGAGAILKRPKALGALGIGLIAFAIYYNRAEIGQVWQSTSPKAPTLVSEQKLNTNLAISMNQSAGQPSNKSAANSGSSTGSEPDEESAKGKEDQLVLASVAKDSDAGADVPWVVPAPVENESLSDEIDASAEWKPVRPASKKNLQLMAKELSEALRPAPIEKINSMGKELAAVLAKTEKPGPARGSLEPKNDVTAKAEAPPSKAVVEIVTASTELKAQNPSSKSTTTLQATGQENQQLAAQVAPPAEVRAPTPATDSAVVSVPITTSASSKGASAVESSDVESKADVAPQSTRAPRDFRVQLAVEHLSARRYVKALAELHKAKKDLPRDPEVRYYLAACHAELRQVDDTVRELKRAIAYEPQYRERAKTDRYFEHVRKNPLFRNALRE